MGNVTITADAAGLIYSPEGRHAIERAAAALGDPATDRVRRIIAGESAARVQGAACDLAKVAAVLAASADPGERELAEAVISAAAGLNDLSRVVRKAGGAA
jgi:hypothetical protein